MSVEMILGSSGQGKSHYLYSYLSEDSVKNPDKEYILIVPEQFSMQAQKDLVDISDRGGTLNVDITSFGRLAYRVFDELGIELKKTIDDTGKNLILRKVLNNKKEELKLLKPNNRCGFTSEIKSVISELMQYGIQPDGVSELVHTDGLSDRLKLKLEDIRCIYQGFMDYIEDKYITVEERLSILCKCIERSAFVKNSIIVMDGFTGFTPVQYELISIMMNLCDKIYISATIPDEENINICSGNDELFAMSKTMASKLGNICDRNGCRFSISKVPFNNTTYRYRDCSELDFLEKNIYRFNGRHYEKEVSNIEIIAMSDPLDEVHNVSARILKLVREEGLRYRDIAVITGDIAQYGPIADKIFTSDNIPHFVDNKRSLITNPMVDYLRAALEIADRNFSYESMFRFLKNGLCSIDREDTDVLENYVLALGIRGYSRWNEKWVRRYPYKKIKDLADINAVRERIIELITPFYEAVISKEAVVSTYVKALYDFCEKNSIYELMEELADEFERNGDMSSASEYRQSYKHVMGLLDLFNELAGDEQMSIREFREILDAGFDEIKVGLIPPTVDAVTVGDVERSRLTNIKALFLIGTNEGVIPAASSNSGVLSDNDRKVLSDNKVELAPFGREKAFINNYYIYLNITKPERFLFISYTELNSESKEMKPSSVISMLKEMYPKLTIRKSSSFGIEDRLTTAEGSMFLIPEGLEHWSSDGEFHSLMEYYMNNEKASKDIRKISACYINDTTSDALSREEARRIYGDKITAGITRIEQFASCAFSHFIKYGLDLEERKQYEIGVADLGSIFHDALYRYSQKLKKEGFTFTSVDQEVSDRLIDESVDEASMEYGNTVLLSSGRNEYIRKRIRTITGRTVWAVKRQLEAGDFTVEGVETDFCYELPDDITITGKIDRLDTAQDDGNVYLKIMDYKSGINSFDYDKLYNGLKLQLMVYMHSAILMEQEKYPLKKIIPSGAFFYHIDDPILDGEKIKSDDIDKEMLSKLKPDGLVNVDASVLMKLDKHYLTGSDVIPISVTKSGGIKESKNAVLADDMNLLADFAVDKMHELGKEIAEGRIDVNPYEESCMYCEYRAICNFDENRPGCNYRKMQKLESIEELRTDSEQGQEVDNNGELDR